MTTTVKIEPKPEDLPEESKTESESESRVFPPLDEIEEIIGYEFTNKRLLEEAFTHGSFSRGSKFSYDRLEYVGDAVLNLLFSREQFHEYPDLNSGQLTRLRASNVDTEKLARVAIKHGLHRYLRHNKPLLEDQIKEFTQELSNYPVHSNGLIDPPKVLADVVESTIGAVYIDSNSSDTVWMVFKGLLEPIISPEMMRPHPKTQLYEMCQKNHLKIKFVDQWEASTSIDVFIDNQFMGRATYKLKKEIAHNRAAKTALENICKLLSEKENIVPKD
ncbi:hypothetical protein UlMin_020847 [Ulmus minor]